MENTYSILPLRDVVVFPGMIVPLFVGREKSVKALDDVVRGDKKILLVTQKNPAVDDPKASDLYNFGTISNVLQMLKLPDGTVKVLVEGRQRAKISSYSEKAGFFEASAGIVTDLIPDDPELEGLARSVVSQFEQYVKLNKKIPPEILGTLNQVEEAGRLADNIAAHITVKIHEKQKLLETIDVMQRLEKIFALMETEIGVLNTEKRIRSRVKRQMEKTQREYYLNEQMKAIQKELGEGEEGKDEISEMEDRIKSLKIPKEAQEKALGELKKLRQMSPMAAEATVIRNYLEWMTTIPWNIQTKVKRNLKQAMQILDEDHFGLEKVKDRILEYLAVQQRTKKIKGPILCLVGPPGVGKTSLAKSIARATGREFVRISLGGVRDEAEIRGHRRTYIGSMPGKIIQSMKKAKVSNPLILLDEIDKMGHDFRGDPASALLEVLDPEQNKTFNDHYLEVDYDLSNVMFVTTANSLNMPRPLLDRMEVIRISGYTEDEKIEITKRHLIPRQKNEHGLRKGEWDISEDALIDLIRYYTREAGVRNLEREIAKLARKSLKDLLVSKKTNKIKISRKNLEKYSGVKKFSYGIAEIDDMVGVTTGLAYTEFGGDLLQIEAVTTPGKGKVTVTGKLGEVMQESVQAASSFVRSRCLTYGITPPQYQNKDIHVHVPEGATPKDGPSAGIAMCTTIVSVLTGIPVRRDVAMTGEVTLRGRVLPIGGLKEKLLAALRGGIKKVIIPKENEKDLAEIPDNVKKGLEIIPVEKVDEVLAIALASPLTPVQWNEEDAKPLPSGDDADGLVLVKH